MPSTAALLTLEQACTALGRRPRTVRRYISEGRLTAYKASDAGGSPLRIPRESVDAFLEAGRVRARTHIRAGAFIDPQGDILAAPQPAAA